MAIRKFFGFIRQALRNALNDYKILKKDQRKEYKVLQLSHRIEKGLIIPLEKQKDGWGYQKFEQLLELCGEPIDQNVRDIGIGVLMAYSSNKAKSLKTIDKNQYILISNNDSFKRVCLLDNSLGGGCIDVSTNTLFKSNSFENIVSGRHSCRDFDLNKHIDKNDILSAVSLANRCPSACNRQPYHVYVVQSGMVVGDAEILKSEYSLFITGVVDAFSLEEYNDWLVSPSIFAGFLVLSLHYHKIGSVIMRKELFYNSNYNNKIRSLCAIPENEKIVLEIRIGSYKQSFKAPCSLRLNSRSLVTFIGKQSLGGKDD